MQESEQRTAPKLYGTVYVVCDGMNSWCGKEVEARIEVLAEFAGQHKRVTCPDCGATHTVHVIKSSRTHDKEGQQA